MGVATDSGMSNTDLEPVTVRRVHAAGSEAALVEFQGAVRDQLIASFRKGYLSTGSYMPDAKAISSQSAMSMGVTASAAAATGLSAAFSSTLYMATANPTSLMQLASGGVGSAIMGPTGIIGQAGFLPIAASVPFVAPMLAIQALSTAMVMQQFQKVDRKLDQIKSTLDAALGRAEATHIGELLSASAVIDDVYEQYELNGLFSTDMLMRLALAEREVSRLAARFHFLVEGQSIDDIAQIKDVQSANYDVHSAMLASFVELRVAHLRVCVDMQENPASVTGDVDRLKMTIANDIEFWEVLMHRSERLRDEIESREAQLQDMNWVKRNLPEFVGGRGSATEKKIAALKDAYVATLESEKSIMEKFLSLIASAKTTLEALESEVAESGAAPTLVYWRDEAGEHSFVTEQLSFSAA